MFIDLLYDLLTEVLGAWAGFKGTTFMGQVVKDQLHCQRYCSRWLVTKSQLLISLLRDWSIAF